MSDSQQYHTIFCLLKDYILMVKLQGHLYFIKRLKILQCFPLWKIHRYWINAEKTMKTLLTRKLAPGTLDRLVRVNTILYSLIWIMQRID